MFFFTPFFEEVMAEALGRCQASLTEEQVEHFREKGSALRDFPNNVQSVDIISIGLAL